MTLNNLVPWNWGRKSSNVPVKREMDAPLSPVRDEESHPVYALQREMNRMFDDFFGSFGSFSSPGSDLMRPLSMLGSEWEAGISSYSPNLDLVETDKELKVTVELPGMDEKDIEVSLLHNALIISGEKKTETKEDVKGYHRVERTYGSFKRSIPLPCEIDQEKVQAVYKNGVLTVTMQKPPSLQSALKRIPIRHG